MKVKYWGVRGSLPSSPSPTEWHSHIAQVIKDFLAEGLGSPSEVNDFLNRREIPAVAGYGVATTCVEITTARGHLIVDGGSGIKNLSDQIMQGRTGRAKGPFHIFMTHFHWDHVIGLPFFVPHFIPGTEVHYYAVQPELEKLIKGIFAKPYFPVPFSSLNSKIYFHVLEPRKPFVIDDMTITPYQLDHPDPCWGLRVESQGKTYAHCVDTEGTRITREELGPDLPLYQGIDLMYFDAQYTLPELAEKANWGHSAAQVGLEIAIREKTGRILFAHHDPGARIEHVQELKLQASEYVDAKKSLSDSDLHIPEYDFAYEGMEIEL